MNGPAQASQNPQVSSDKNERASASLQSAESMLAQALALPLRAVRFGVTTSQRMVAKVSDSALYARTVAVAYAPEAVTEYTQNRLVPLAKDYAATTKDQVQAKSQELARWAQTEGRMRAPEKVVHAVEQTVQQLGGMRSEARQLADKSQGFVEATIQDPDDAARSLASTIVSKTRSVLPPQVQEIISVWSDVVVALYLQALQSLRAMRANVGTHYDANRAYLQQIRVSLANKINGMAACVAETGRRLAEALSPKSYIDLSREQSVTSALEQLVRDISKNPYVARTIEGIDEMAVRYLPVGITSWTRRALPRYINGNDAELQRQHEERDREANGHSTAVDDQNSAEKRKKKKKSAP